MCVYAHPYVCVHLDASVPVGVIPSLPAVCSLSDRLGCRKSLFISQLTHYTIDHSPADGWVSLLAKLLFLNVNESTFVLLCCFFTPEGKSGVTSHPCCVIMQSERSETVFHDSVYVKSLSSCKVGKRCAHVCKSDLRSDQRCCSHMVYILTKCSVKWVLYWPTIFAKFGGALLPLNIDEGHHII